MRAAEIIAKVPKKPHYYPTGKQLPNIPITWIGNSTQARSIHIGGWHHLY